MCVCVCVCACVCVCVYVMSLVSRKICCIPYIQQIYEDDAIH